MKWVFFAVAAALTLGVAPVLAEAPTVKTPAPVIYLADNLDEADNLGWCIDTIGRGFSEQLHAHSCKPQGGDVQFSYDPTSHQIQSVEFSGKCATLSAPGDARIPFGLLDCVDGDPRQQFAYNTRNGQFNLTAQSDLCLAVAPSSRSAGPFMSRDLTLASCVDGDGRLLKWVVLP